MNEYEGEKEASVGRLEEVDLPHEDSDDSLNLLFSVTVADTETNEIENKLWMKSKARIHSSARNAGKYASLKVGYKAYT